MESTAAAQERAAEASARDGTLGRGWRSRWAVRAGIPAIYLLGTAIAIDRVGLPYSQDWIFVWIVGLMVAFSIADGQHSLQRLVKDWLPIIVALLAYDLLRGVADGNLIPVHWQPPVDADKLLGLGQVPTVRLQDALYTPGHLHLWDYAAFGFWFSHFFATLLVAVAIWLYRYQWFHRFAACIVVLAAMGLITYVVFPAAPPWLAAHNGYIDHTYRITHAVVNNLPVPKAGALFQSGTDWGNDVAAVPSLHAAYTMLICLFLWPRVSGRWRPLLAAYPIGMGLSLIYLGEHYLIDILLGWAYAAVAVYLVNWAFERWGRRSEDANAGFAAGARPRAAVPDSRSRLRPSLMVRRPGRR
jgi:membrane-associated phospholipid phosphatase